MSQRTTLWAALRRAWTGCCSLALAALLLTAPAASLADNATNASQGSGSSEELPGYHRAEADPELEEERQSIARMEQRVDALEQKLAEIRDNVLDSNPDLEEQLKDLVLTRNEVMEKNLAEEQVDIQKLNNLRQNLEQEGLEDSERKALEKEFKDMYLGYKRAEMRTQQNETVQSMRKDFYADLLEAFKAENPKAEELISELGRLKHQLRYAKERAVPEDNSTSGRKSTD